MKTKIISNTYLRDVKKYQIKFYLDEDEYYICVKKLIECTEKFIIRDNVCVMDNGYYILEVMPKNEDYAMRLFLDKDKNPLEYYFDICKNIRIDENTKIPMYDDLYLDVTSYHKDINVLDEDELLDAYNNGEFSKRELEHIYKVKDKIIDEIKSDTNKCMNIKYLEYLKDM